MGAGGGEVYARNKQQDSKKGFRSLLKDICMNADLY